MTIYLKDENGTLIPAQNGYNGGKGQIIATQIKLNAVYIAT